MALGDFRFVLAGGIPSSGSTLLSVMLDSHPDILCGPETSLFHQAGVWREHRLLGSLLEENPSDGDLPKDWLPWGRPSEDVLNYYGRDSRFVLDSARQARDMGEFIDAFYGESRKSRQQAVVVDKTPQNIYAMDAALSRFNDITAIVMVRHPVSVIDSLIRRGVHPKIASAVWLHDAAIIHALWRKYSKKNPARLLLVRYEDLVSETEQTLSGLCRFLGVEVDVESMLTRKYTNRGKEDPTLMPDEKSVVSKWNYNPLAEVNRSGLKGIESVDKHRESIDYLFTIRFRHSDISRYVRNRGIVNPARLLADFKYGDINKNERPEFKKGSFVSERVLTAYEKFYAFRIVFQYDIKYRLKRPAKRLVNLFRNFPLYCEQILFFAKKTIKTTARTVKHILVPVVRFARRRLRSIRNLYRKEDISGSLIEVQSIVVPLPKDVDYDIVGVIAFLDRHRVLEVVIREIMMLNQYEGARTGLVLACSNTVDAGFAQSIRNYYGDIGIVETGNNPLGRKWQAAVDCAREASPEFLYITGSDDVITHDYLMNNMRIMSDCALGEITMCGPRTWYMTDLSKADEGENLPVWKVSYRNEFHMMPLGAGRIYNRRFLDSINWRIFEPGLDKLLDDRGYDLVRARGGRIYVPTLDDGFVLSVKGNWNALNAADSILSADSIAACKVNEREFRHISMTLSGTWQDIINLAKQG